MTAERVSLSQDGSTTGCPNSEVIYTQKKKTTKNRTQVVFRYLYMHASVHTCIRVIMETEEEEAINLRVEEAHGRSQREETWEGLKKGKG